MEFLKTSDIDELIAHLLYINLNFQSLNKAVESKFNLSIVQWAFLKTLLQMPAVSPQVLARVLHITPGTLTQTAARLEKRQYIFICADPKDARKKMISLSRTGKDILEGVDKYFKVFFASIKKYKNEIVAVENYLDHALRKLVSDLADSHDYA